MLRAIAEEVGAVTPGSIRVAVDGVDGAGKSVFADQLAAVMRALGREVVRVSVDGFHNPREVRYRQGRDDPRGFFEDSYDYRRLVKLVLEPFGPGGSRIYTPAVHDVSLERPVSVPALLAPPDSILVLDGIFLHRDELVAYWDCSIWLEVPFEISIARVARRGIDGSGSPDPDDARNRRYVEGQRIYIRSCCPAERATFVVDNADLAAPVLRRNVRVRGNA